MSRCKKKRDYFVGVDVGTDSTGYAVTYDDYSIVKHKGEPMWGTCLFESANQCDERREFRTARRRLDRRQQRVELIRELFAEEVGAVDSDFFARLKESHLFAEDKSTEGEYDFLRNELFDGRHYNEKYPTIHHLIHELMTSEIKHDVRLVYIACAWLVAHRGHFLSEVDKKSIHNILNFQPIYDDFIRHFDGELEEPWQCDAKTFSEILKRKIRIAEKEKLFIDLLFEGKKPKKDVTDSTPYCIPLMIKLLCGGSVKVSDFFAKEEYSGLKSMSLGMPDEELMAIFAEIDADAEVLVKLKAMYDWAVLTDVLNGCGCISEAKIAVYEQHKEDLRNLKKFIRKYCPKKYNEVFREATKIKNYVAYSKHADKKNISGDFKGANKIDFSEYLSKLLKNVECDELDKPYYDEMMERLATNTFLPKQVDGDNRVIPYQLYWYELKEVLSKAESYLPFLKRIDESGFSVSEKILSVFEFRIPYFVGPLTVTENSQFAWMKRKCEGRIYPWNFEKMVDLDVSEQEFIRRMTNTCTYIPGEYVLPKNSLLYTKFEVLNEINNIKVNGEQISVEQKQLIYNELYVNVAKVTPKRLKSFMVVNGICESDSVISGIDMDGSIKSSLKVYKDFAGLMSRGLMSVDEVELFINHCAYSEDKIRMKKWIDRTFPKLDIKDRKYLYNLKYKNFGRLSEKLLNGITGVDKRSGELGTILYFLWNTNDNLMQILSDNYTFKDEINLLSEEYYKNKKRSLTDVMDEMYISNSVKRPILRTLDILKDIEKAMGYAPKKIFVEMARGADENEKKKRKASRKDQITELYKTIKTSEVKALSKELETLGEMADNRLQSDVLFLYFMQLGRCAYSGEKLDVEKLKTSVYNIDHIYPQCYVKDDSVLNNKVLVLSKYNSDKGDSYPINPVWKENMMGFWKMLHNSKLMTDEKYKRLIRSTPFTNEEKLGFINRQLVETRQSTKALARILEKYYPETKVVYVKADLVSRFRHKYDVLKCRSINDLHHAKDAYLNVVVGNVYNERFTKKWFSVENKYSLNYDVIFGTPLIREGKEIWSGETGIERVVNNMHKNAVHLTRFAFCRKGGLFDQQPVKAASGLVPLKKGLPTEKYGGYNKTTASFFVLVKYDTQKGSDIMIMPVELMYSKRFLADAGFADEYAKTVIGDTFNKEILSVSFPMNKRILKINTVFSVDGFEMSLGSKRSGGRELGFISVSSMFVDYSKNNYIKKLERFNEKKTKNSKIVIDSEYDEISSEKNIIIYDFYAEKSASKPFVKMKGNPVEILKNSKPVFENLNVEEQIDVLLNVVNLFKTGRTGTVDLSLIDGSKNAGTLCISSNLSNWKNSFSDVRIVDYSPSGIHKKVSKNLLELL